MTDVSPSVTVPSRDHVASDAPALAELRVAIAHDWLVNYAGSERVVEQIRRMFPDARLLTTLFDEGTMPVGLHGAETFLLQAIPGATARHEWALPLMPLDWRLRGPVADVDIVISSSHACAKAVRVGEGIPHVCYCHTPMRYAWNYDAERERFPFLLRVPVRAAMAGFRRWDKRVARGVTHFIANSNAVAERIQTNYGRPASVVHPPVDTEYFSAGGERRGYYLYAGRLVQYKRPDVLVDAFAELPDQELTIAGAGPMLDKLRARATPNVKFVISPDKRQLRDLYRGASALLQAGEEDFGITMAEAQSCGTPVIALGRGGALDVVTDGETGLTFSAPTLGAVRSAIRRASAIDWDFEHIAANATRFSHDAFRNRIRDQISNVVSTSQRVA